MRIRPTLLLAALLAGACGKSEPTIIDGSSAEAFQRTVTEARNDVPDRDRLIFDRAVRTIGGRWHGAADQEKLARTTFDGMTGREVVEDQKSREEGGGRR